MALLPQWRQVSAEERGEPKGKITEAATGATVPLSKPRSLVLEKKYAGHSCVGSEEVSHLQSGGITAGLAGPAEGGRQQPSRAKPLQGFK